MAEKNVFYSGNQACARSCVTS